MNVIARRRRLPAATHTHDYRWTLDPQGVAWHVHATCLCGATYWGCTARSTSELNATLAYAFARDQLPPSAYFLAPTVVPEVPA